MTDQALIERLIRLADPGPELPPGGERRIRAAARAIWHNEVRARARRRHLVGVAALAAAAAVALVITMLPRREAVVQAPPRPVARVELVRGPVSGALRSNPIVADAALETGSASRAALRLRGGQALRLDSGTAIRLLSATVVELEHGAIYVDSGGHRAMPVEVRTRFGTVRDIGTRFEVRATESLGVAVREGSVGVSTPREHFHVAAGFAATVRGEWHEVHALAAGGASWTASIAPPFALEGRTFDDLLRWCSQETGLAVHYRDQEVEQLAHAAQLHGAPLDADPVEAVEMIAPTVGLTAVRGDGALIVKRHPSPR